MSCGGLYPDGNAFVNTHVAHCTVAARPLTLPELAAVFPRSSLQTSDTMLGADTHKRVAPSLRRLIKVFCLTPVLVQPSGIYPRDPVRDVGAWASSCRDTSLSCDTGFITLLRFGGRHALQFLFPNGSRKSC